MPPLRLSTGAKEIGPIAFESGGSGSAATSPREARKKTAGVRLTASDYQSDGVEWVAKDPFLMVGE